MTRRVMAVLSFIVLILTAGATPASAYATFGHRLTYGVGNYGASTQRYFVDASAASYLSLITGAMDTWVRTTEPWGITTPISYSRTTTKSSSRMDHYKSSGVGEWWGLTQFYSGNTSVDPSARNWIYAKVWLDSDFDRCPNKKGVIAHEQGHAMGLAHVSSGTAVMRYDIGLGALNRITRAQPDDLRGINHLY